ncbi:hypothetical protein [Bradyrhizobium sp. LHD-71]|uniref:hypothetical protein n=1 Tax=Bradyrhizobium sp. LHD-71 TaxID=3072141 RepID=UPI00280DABC6|nr:hypothetical protein [Bradyrhizobium sp. LHD-71]MDQ8726690.1 hypothetical protein [Bradyrhizobium sp. LHD-71]
MEYGARLVSLAALLGTAVSLYNYFDPLSGIAGTPGAILVIASTLILFVFGLIMAARPYSLGLRVFLAASSLLAIVGTAFAAHLLNSRALLGLMAVCLLGWLMHLFAPRRALA